MSRRPLSSREEQVLLAMIDRADEDDGGPEPTDEVRNGWRSRVPDLSVDGSSGCGCGQCPSVSLAYRRAPATPDFEDRVVLSASVPDALVFVFIDDGVPSYLELAPLDDEIVFAEFPEASSLSFSSGTIPLSGDI